MQKCYWFKCYWFTRSDNLINYILLPWVSFMVHFFACSCVWHTGVWAYVRTSVQHMYILHAFMKNPEVHIRCPP